jgi:hypothetical protein
LSEDKKKIVQELHIDLGHYPFVPTVGIAQSPDGKIYYGGYQIYTLDSIGKREQALFIVKLDRPSTVDISQVDVDREQKRIVIDANVNGAVTRDSKVVAKIPRALLDNIATVAVNSEQGPIPIASNVNGSDPDYNTVTINIGSSASKENNNNLEMTLAGPFVAPEFSPSVFLAIALVVLVVTVNLRIWRRSL